MAITSFIPTIWSARLIEALENTHVAAGLVNRDYEGEITGQGDQVKINSIGTVAIKSYTKNTDMAAADDLATTASTLVISQAKYFNFQVDDIDKVQAAGDLVDAAMRKAAYGLADAADKYLLGVMSAGAQTKIAETQLTAANIYTEIIKIRTALDKANVPTAGRFLVIPPEAYALLLQDARFVSGGGAQAEETVRNGLVGRVAGFDIFESNNVPTEKKSGYDDYHLIAGIAEATTYAEQIVKTEAYSPELRFADAVKGLHVYGAVVTRPEAVVDYTAKF